MRTPPPRDTRRRCLAAILAACIASCGQPSEDPDPFGYEQLKRELGDATPDGSGVAVHLVEPSADVFEEIDGVETKIGVGFAPDVAILEFAGKDIDVTPGIFSQHSGHATGMGRRVFGNATSTSPGISEVHVWETMTWMGSVLNLGRNRLPEASDARVANHSWVGSADHPELPGARNRLAMRRLDWLVDTDEFVQVAGFNGSVGNPLFGSAYNVIAVSHVVGAFAAGSAQVGPGDYPAKRVRPHIVVPEKNPSSAAARVSSAVAILIQAGRRDAGGSTDPLESTTTTRSGLRIHNAERSEVIRAALYAGATPVDDPAVPAEIAANGMDRRFGAGLLNIYGSYRAIAAGEQNSAEDDSGAGEVSLTGFDYDPEFGGAGERNATATYRIPSAEIDRELTAALVWNAHVPTGRDLVFGAEVEVADLDLELYDVFNPERWVSVAGSTGRLDNVELLRVQLRAGAEYALRVETAPDQRPFAWDYGLAWRIGDAESPAGR